MIDKAENFRIVWNMQSESSWFEKVQIRQRREFPWIDGKCLEDYRVQIEVGALGECIFATANYHDFLVDFWVRPLTYLRSAEEVLLEHDNRRLVWYDLRRKKRLRMCRFRYVDFFFFGWIGMSNLGEEKEKLMSKLQLVLLFNNLTQSQPKRFGGFRWIFFFFFFWKDGEIFKWDFYVII